MNKYFVTVFLGFAALAVGWLLIQEPDSAARHTKPAATTEAAGGAPQAPEDDAAPLPLTPPLGAGGAGGAADTLEGELPGGLGGSPPALEDAPKSVRLGVILVQYQGAEDVARDARSKTEARELAEKLAAQARDDFEAAAKNGDPGSTSDAGQFFRGILAPEIEVPVFTLDEGEISEPIDTPKGFWIVKRLE